MEPGTGLTILGTALGSAKLVEKLLGPTADYLGSGLKNWTARRVTNLSRVFKNATEKLGERINEPGAVPPRVLKGVLEVASFCDDELAAQYLGGVLASSRTGVSRDDRASAYLALLDKLSSYQIRAHYGFYHLLKLETNVLPFGWPSATMSVTAFGRYMDFSDDEDPKVLFNHIMAGLLRETLIKHVVTPEEEEVWRIISRHTKAPYFMIGSTIPGIELFLWAYGRSDLSYEDFFRADVNFDVDPSIHFNFESSMQ